MLLTASDAGRDAFTGVRHTASTTEQRTHLFWFLPHSRAATRTKLLLSDTTRLRPAFVSGSTDFLMSQLIDSCQDGVKTPVSAFCVAAVCDSCHLINTESKRVVLLPQ